MVHKNAHQHGLLQAHQHRLYKPPGCSRWHEPISVRLLVKQHAQPVLIKVCQHWQCLPLPPFGLTDTTMLTEPELMGLIAEASDLALLTGATARPLAATCLACIGLFNTLYYTVAFLVVWFKVANVATGTPIDWLTSAAGLPP